MRLSGLWLCGVFPLLGRPLAAHSSTLVVKTRLINLHMKPTKINDRAEVPNCPNHTYHKVSLSQIQDSEILSFLS